MKRRNYKTIFYDEGVRWGRVKKSLAVLLVFVLSMLFLISYSFIYSPFETDISGSKKSRIHREIEDINNSHRPIVNQGTFITIEDLYGTTYVKRFGEDKKFVSLTFDDGPDPKYTPQILKILEHEGIKASFFALGDKLYKYPEIGQQVLNQGSDMGVHTFSHHAVGNDGKISKLRFIYELDFTEKIFAHNYGYKSNLFRVPYQGVEENPSYYALQYIREANLRGLSISAPTLDSSDWLLRNEEEVIKNSTNPEVMGSVILLHDSGGDRNTTVKALPGIIKFYKDKGYEFVTISQLANAHNIKTKNHITKKDKLLIPLAYNSYDLYKKSPGFLKKLFATGLFLVVIHMSIFIILAISQVYQDKYTKMRKNKKRIARKNQELISIIIPMYNEESSIKSVLRSIIKSTYKNLQIIVIDDGSTDASYKKAKEIKDKRITIIQKANAGKFSALNYGFRYATGKITVCLDADTRVKSNAIMQIYFEFSNKKVAAVAGNIKIGNKKNVLTRIQSLEYILAQGIEKRSLDLFSSVMVVPGAFGAWRTKKVKSLGGFSPRILAEDFDLTLRLMKIKNKISYSDEAIAYTEAPITLKQLYIQRRRWTFGNLQVLFKHRDMILKRKYGPIGMFFMPRTIFLQIPSIILTPFVDLFVILNLLHGERSLTMSFILFYFIIQIFLTLVAYKLAKESPVDIKYIPLLRFPYAQFLYIIFFEAIFKVMKGETNVWKKLHHTGRFTVSSDKNPAFSYEYLSVFLNKIL